MWYNTKKVNTPVLFVKINPGQEPRVRFIFTIRLSVEWPSLVISSCTAIIWITFSAGKPRHRTAFIDIAQTCSILVCWHQSPFSQVIKVHNIYQMNTISQSTSANFWATLNFSTPVFSQGKVQYNWVIRPLWCSGASACSVTCLCLAGRTLQAG